MTKELIAIRLEDGVTALVDVSAIVYANVAPQAIRLLLVGGHGVKITRHETQPDDYQYLADRLLAIAAQSREA